MRIPSPIALAAAAALVAASLAPAGASSLRSVHQSLSRGHVNLMGAKAVPGKANQQIARHPLAMAGARSWMRPDKKGGCIYVSDNLSGVVSVYAGKSPWGLQGTLTSASLYGWGVAAGGKKKSAVVYIGTYSDTIDFYTPCTGTTPTGSVTGTGNYPYGITVAPNGNLYATSWPSNTTDYWTAPVTNGEAASSGVDANQALTYFVDADKTTTYLTGYNTSESAETVDGCSLTITGCATLVSIAGGFPGGSQIDSGGNLYVNNQYGTLYSYSGCPGACTSSGTFTYSNGTNPLDYTATALDKKAKNLWGANIYYCSSSYGLCGDGQSQSLPGHSVAGSALNGTTTPALSNSEPLGIAVYKQDKV